MTANAILLDEKDNVATCTAEVAPGTCVACFGGANAEVESTETIPIWHKIALCPIPNGGQIFKYGELIGEARTDIPCGGWVSHENIFSVPRDYASEYIGKDV